MQINVLLLLLVITYRVFSYKHQNQLNELRRQYDDYLKIFSKKERPNSYNMFVENLSRISNRQCDLHVDRFTDEELTYLNCS